MHKCVISKIRGYIKEPVESRNIAVDWVSMHTGRPTAADTFSTCLMYGGIISVTFKLCPRIVQSFMWRAETREFPRKLYVSTIPSRKKARKYISAGSRITVSNLNVDAPCFATTCFAVNYARPSIKHLPAEIMRELSLRVFVNLGGKN